MHRAELHSKVKGSLKLAHNYWKTHCKKETTEEEEKEANCSRDLQRSQTVLDYTNPVLAMGEGSCSDKDVRRSADRDVRTGK
jgi:hypothetical protein